MSGRVFRRSVVADPPVAVTAHGSTIVDAAGRSYLDAAGGAIVVNVGHGRQEIADAMADQAGRLAYAHGSAFTTEPLEAYAREVGDLLPVDDPAIYPVSGGSEAIETALKLARAFHLARGNPDRDRRLRPVGQLPRQLARCPGPVGPAAAAPPLRAVARHVPTRLGGLPISRRVSRRARARRRACAGGGARAGDPPRGSSKCRRVRRRADRGGDPRRRRPARRLLAGHRRRLSPTRRSAHRRRGHDGLRSDRSLVRPRPLASPGRTSSWPRRARRPATGRSGSPRRHRACSRRSPSAAPASCTGSPTRTRPSARPSPARCCGSSATSHSSKRARPRASGSVRGSRRDLRATPPSARSAVAACSSASSSSRTWRRVGRTRAPRASPRPSSRPLANAGVLVYSGTGNANGVDGDTILLGPPFIVTDDELDRIVEATGEAIDIAVAAIGAPAG